jgi:cell division protein FtsL
MKPRRSDPAVLRFWVKLIGAFFVVLMLTVWEHVQAVNLEKDLRGLRRETDRLTYENGRMSMQIHQWESPSHLDIVARKELGMIPIDAQHVIGLHQP